MIIFRGDGVQLLKNYLYKKKITGCLMTIKLKLIKITLVR